MVKSSGARILLFCLVFGCILGFQDCDRFSAVSGLTQETASTSASSVSPSPTPVSVSPTPIAADETAVYQTAQVDAGGVSLIRQSIFLQIGGSAPIEVMLDTGSTGLRVLAGVLMPNEYTNTGVATIYGFGAGQLTGTIATAQIRIGATTTTQAIDFQLVAANGIGCPAASPNCAFKNGSTAPFGVGSTGKPYQAIIGVSLKGDTLLNPLSAMGLKTWMLSLGLPSMPTQTGKLVMNKTDIDMDGFKTIHLQKQTTATNGATPLWQDNQIPACVINNVTSQSLCYGSSVDTGAYDIRAIPVSPAAVNWTTGVSATLRFIDDQNEDLDTTFLVGSSVENSVDLPPTTTGLRNMNLGPLPLYSYNFLYDIVNGVISLQQK